MSCYAAYEYEVSEYLVDGTKLNLGRKMMILYINVELDVATIIKHEHGGVEIVGAACSEVGRS